jgi:hypothetical protein
MSRTTSHINHASHHPTFSIMHKINKQRPDPFGLAIGGEVGYFDDAFSQTIIPGAGPVFHDVNWFSGWVPWDIQISDNKKSQPAIW